MQPDRTINVRNGDALERCTYRTVIDVLKIERMARKAALSKTGVCQAGAVRVKIVDRQVMPIAKLTGTGTGTGKQAS